MINFSNGQVLQLDEFLDFYKTVDISAENYDSEKSIGLYTGMVIPTECTMLKFRYYTPDGTLIEQENVPLVYDGNSVDHIITKYLLTNKSSGVDYDTEGWTEELQTPSKDVRFVYTYEISVYTNGAEIKTNIVLTSVYGEQGERGSIYLGCYAKNSDVISAYTARGIVSDDYYLNKTNGKIYVCSRNGDLITWTPVAYGDSAAVNKMYSNAVNDALGSGLEGATDIVQALTVWTKNLVASSAFINELVTSKLFSNEITLKTGGVIKSENYNEDSIKEDEQGNKYIDTENYSDTGWAFDSKGTADLVNVHATGGEFMDIKIAGSSEFSGITKFNEISNISLGFLNFCDVIEDKKIYVTYRSNNIYSVKKISTGIYVIEFDSVPEILLSSEYGSLYPTLDVRWGSYACKTTTIGNFVTKYGYANKQAKIMPINLQYDVINDKYLYYSENADCSYSSTKLGYIHNFCFPALMGDRQKNGSTIWYIGLCVTNGESYVNLIGGCDIFITFCMPSKSILNNKDHYTPLISSY